MRHFNKSLFLFFLFFASFYIIGLLALPKAFKKNLIYIPGGKGYTGVRLQNISRIKGVDVLFLGSSHAYRSFDPRIFSAAGFTSFNLGTSSQSPLQTQMLVKKYLSELSPKLVVYEVNPLVFSSDGVESSLDIISNDKVTLSTAKMALGVNNLKTYHLFIYAFVRGLIGGREVLAEKRALGDDKYIDGGFVEKKLKHYHYKKFSSFKYDLNPKQLEAFDETLQYLLSKNIKVLLVQSPVSSAYYNAASNNEDFDSTIRSRKQPYYNFNQLVQLDDSLNFYDRHHLNQSGVQVVDEKLISILKEKYDYLVAN